jgi:hypothetical protein
VSSYGLSWQKSFGIIVVLYFYSHYLFASGAAHIGAMYTAFLSVAVACGTPGMLAAIALGQVKYWTPCEILGFSSRMFMTLPPSGSCAYDLPSRGRSMRSMLAAIALGKLVNHKSYIVPGVTG